MASMAMTEQTPKMMPSMVSSERSLCSMRLFMPSRTVLMNWKVKGFMKSRNTEYGARLPIHHLPLNQPILHMDHPVRPGGDFLVVGHEHDGLARAVELVDQVKDFESGAGVEVAGGFVGQNHQRIVDQRTG